MSDKPLRVAIIGMGGFAQEHHNAIRALEKRGECCLVATCDPNPDTFAAKQSEWEFGRRGISVFDDYRTMLNSLAGELDLVTIPTPIPLHATMHRACVERKIACYLEKPPTLDYRELEAMIRVDENATKQTQVGFNFIGDPNRIALRKRIDSGEFGHVKRVTFRGLWPRAVGYFERAGWAGRLFSEDGRPLLDSCIGNAMAHYMQNILYWAGHPSPNSNGTEFIESVHAELYRAHSIENFDTAFVRAHCENGVELRIAASHACDGASENIEEVHCEHARIHINTKADIQISGSGEVETIPAVPRGYLKENLQEYCRYLRSESAHPQITLADSRPFVRLVDLAYVAAGRITNVKSPFLSISGSPGAPNTTVVIDTLPQVFTAFLDDDAFPSDQYLPWAVKGGGANRRELEHFPAILAQML